MTAAALPRFPRRAGAVVDYAGALLIAASASCFVLLTTLGGTHYPWISEPTIALAGAGVLLLAGFMFVESRVPEAILPPRLLRLRAFTTSSAVGFVVGFAMFGSITYLPLYLQVVQGATPTNSGLRLIAMMAGLLLTSTISGQIISRWGRYKVFPVAGCAIFSIGLFLLSSMNAQTNALVLEAYMFVLGVGLGMVMQVLVIVVQNAVQYRDLGAATSGVTFFRSIGSSFGVAIFGAIFSNDLAANVMRYLPSGVSLSTLQSNPQHLEQLPAAVHLGYVHAYAAALQPVFFAAGCIGVVAFLLAWLIPEVPLRETTRTPDTGEVYGIPSDRTSAQELERALAVLSNREGRLRSYQRLAELAGVDLDPASCWMLIRVGPEPISATQLAGKLGTSVPRLQPALDKLENEGYVIRAGETLSLPETGALAYKRLVDGGAKRARHALARLVAGATTRNGRHGTIARRTVAQRRLRGRPARVPNATARHRKRNVNVRASQGFRAHRDQSCAPMRSLIFAAFVFALIGATPVEAATVTFSCETLAHRQFLLDDPAISARVVKQVYVPGKTPLYHRHKVGEILYVLAGHGSSISDGKTTPLLPGQVLIVPAKTEHAITATGASGLTVLAVQLSDRKSPWWKTRNGEKPKACND